MAEDNSLAQSRSKEFEAQLLQQMGVLYSVALQFTRNAADAEDLLQDAMLKALRFHHRFNKGTHLKAWLLTIMRNTFINDYRKRARRPPQADWAIVEDIPDVKPDREMGYFPRQLMAADVLELLHDDVRHAVDALPEGHRQAVIMADLQDMSYNEIADIMGCPLGTVMSRLHRGRRLLRESLAEYRDQVAVSVS